MARIRIGKGLGTLDDPTLSFLRQIGVEQVILPSNCQTQAVFRPLVPPAQKGPARRHVEQLDKERLAYAIEHVRSHGLEAVGIQMAPSASILMGLADQDQEIEAYTSNVILAGEMGLSVVTYNFTALRASEGYGARRGKGRGGASLRDYDFCRIEGLPPLPNIGEHSRELMWQRLSYFVRAVVPTAEKAGVRMALHPNDPPVAVYRGVAQPVHSLQDMIDVLNLVDSPSNGLFLDTGVLTELGEDAPAVIRTVGKWGRIGAVHMRNVRAECGPTRYLEEFHDLGDCDLAECMRALHEVNYGGLVDPDHTPEISGDTRDARAGWALAIGHIMGLRSAVESMKRRTTP